MSPVMIGVGNLMSDMDSIIDNSPIQDKIQQKSDSLFGKNFQENHTYSNTLADIQEKNKK